MICLDNDAFIAAYQHEPAATSAVHTARIRAFISAVGVRVMVPAVALSEYLFGFADTARLNEVQTLLRRNHFIPPFDQSTAEVAAQLGRAFVAGRGLGEVAKAHGSCRVCLKADLLIVASAVQHGAQHFVADDLLPLAIARFAGLTAHRLSELPDPTPPTSIPQDNGARPVGSSLFDEPPSN